MEKFTDYFIESLREKKYSKNPNFIYVIAKINTKNIHFIEKGYVLLKCEREEIINNRNCTLEKVFKNLRQNLGIPSSLFSETNDFNLPGLFGLKGRVIQKYTDGLKKFDEIYEVVPGKICDVITVKEYESHKNIESNKKLYITTARQSWKDDILSKYIDEYCEENSSVDTISELQQYISGGITYGWNTNSKDCSLEAMLHPFTAKSDNDAIYLANKLISANKRKFKYCFPVSLAFKYNLPERDIKEFADKQILDISKATPNEIFKLLAHYNLEMSYVSFYKGAPRLEKNHIIYLIESKYFEIPESEKESPTQISINRIKSRFSSLLLFQPEINEDMIFEIFTGNEQYLTETLKEEAIKAYLKSTIKSDSLNLFLEML